MEERAHIRDYFSMKFQSLFSTTNPVFSEFLDNLTQVSVSDSENMEILRVPSEEEIKDCIWSMHPLKALGLDGFPRAFFRSYWDTIKMQVEGRWIVENTMVVHELVHKVKKYKGKHELMLMKIDIKRAYDSLEWSFVEKALDLWAFSGEVRKLVVSCIITVEYNVLLNGSKTDWLTPTRGSRQGDPLSPFLFILSAEVFSRMLEKH